MCLSIGSYTIFCPATWLRQSTFMDKHVMFSLSSNYWYEDVSVSQTFTKNKSPGCVSPPFLPVMVKMINWHHKPSHVIGTKLSRQTMFAFCALPTTSTSIWLCVCEATGSTVMPLVQLLRLGLIYIRAHPPINWRNVSAANSVQAVATDQVKGKRFLQGELMTTGCAKWFPLVAEPDQVNTQGMSLPQKALPRTPRCSSSCMLSIWCVLKKEDSDIKNL